MTITQLSRLSTGIAVSCVATTVVSCDSVTTIPAGALGAQVGVLLHHREQALSDAIHAAFDLD